MADIKELKFLTPRDIGVLFNICYYNALCFIKYSGVDYIKIGRAYRVEESVLYKFLENNRNIKIDEF